MYGCIYKLENLVNGRLYIGQTIVKPEKRKADHFYQLKKNIHKNSHLQNSFNFHGESNFKFDVLCWFNSQEELNEAEIYYINFYDTLNRDKGYNVKEGGSNGKLAKETRHKISLALQGASHPLYDKNHSLETRQKISEALKGKRHTLESRHKMSISRQNMSIETKHKIGISKKGGNNFKYGKGIFGFPGAYLDKRSNVKHKPWYTTITFKGRQKRLSSYHDPLSASIVWGLVRNEIWGDMPLQQSAD
jgi:group I intron endonuclease